jgi:amino acid adenylation domain-containing protein/FkbM family methyltransferase
MTKQGVIEGFRLSPEQKRLWTLQQNSAAYYMQCAFLIEGDLDRKALIDVLKRLVARHEILRTTFRCLPGLDVPIQIIDDEPRFLCDEIDLRRQDEHDRDRRLDTILREQRNPGFDFEKGPLARFCLVSLSTNRHVLTVVMPALCGDAVSAVNLLREISEGYRLYLSGDLNGQELSDQVVQYVDFSEWRNELSETAEASAGKAFWQTQISSGIATPRLPFENESAPSAVFKPAVMSWTADSGATDKIDEICARQGTSVSTALLVCWQILLSRLTGQSELTVFNWFDGRKIKHLRSAIGLFEKYLPLSYKVENNRSFGEMLASVGDRVSSGYQRQDFFPADFQLLQNGDSASPGRWPVAFDYLERAEIYISADLSWSIIDQSSYTDRFKLRLSTKRSGRSLGFSLHYDPTLYSDAEARNVADQYSAILLSALANPEALVADLEIVGGELREQILYRWNQTEVEFPADRLIHNLIEEQAANNPDSAAVAFRGEVLAFGALNCRANHLANYLRAKGVGPEALVAVALDRGVEMVVAVLGVLKAGGAYLPLDPGQPKQRLTRMLDEARPLVVLTTSSLRARLDGQTAEVLCLDSQWETVAAHGAWPSERIGPGNLAYVIYTSGSSGRPKGVMISHRSLMNLAEALNESVYERAEEGMRVSVNAPLGFDASVKQIAQLAYGRTLVVVPEEVRADGEEMVKYVEAQNVEALDCTPSQLKLMLAGGMNERRGQGAVKVLVGGEAIDERLWGELGADEWRRYYNVYGPTECTVDASVKEVRGERATIGRPIGNVKMYILDERRRPVGIGETGEIYIGGEGLGRGYLKRAEMTAERYIPNEFSAEGGERLYQTGDLGRYRADGEIECLGRTDKQVKVRGHRIELGEIEEVLREHPGIEQAVTVLRETGRDDKRIEAFVVGRKNAPGNISGRKTYKLPNGLEVLHQNKNETDYLYEEIFEKNSYIRNGIELEDGGCVFDVGANIGMFAMYVSEVTKAQKIYAFEPIKEIYESLKLNLSRYGDSVKVYQMGISNREGVEKFTYYPRYTMMSGKSAFANRIAEEEVIKKYLKNEEAAGRNGRDVSEREMEELLEGRFEAREHECAIRTLTSVMREEGVEKIDLLKVDVQRAEKEVLEGIEEEEWRKINQVVMEVHDQQGDVSEGRTRQLKDMLEARGYEVHIEQDDLLKGTDRYNLYAVRGEVKKERENAGLSRSKWHGRNGAGNSAPIRSVTVESLRDYLGERIPEYMIPAAIMIIEEMPLTRNGKVDRDRLPTALDVRDGEKNVRPRTEIEELMRGIWKDVLGAKEIDLEEGFFELGGHSLLATQLMSRVRKIFKVELGLRRLFEEPTVRRLSGVVEKELRRGAIKELPPIERTKSEATRPLSYAQERLWFLEQLEPGKGIYNCPITVKLEGRLGESVLEQALREIVRRHETLRTKIETVGGNGVGIAEGDVHLRLGVVDLTAIDGEEKAAAIDKLIAEEAWRPFQLEKGRLLRVKLLKIGDEEHLILLTMHHIVSDGWSMEVLVREVGELYGAFARGDASLLDELPIQYADYAAWQKEWLKGDVLEEQLGYWRERLGGEAPALELPTDRPRGAAQTYQGAKAICVIGEELTEGGRRLSRKQGCTLYITLLAAFQTLLSKLSGQQDIVVGTDIANRTHGETEALLGFFVNQLVMRANLAGNPTFIGLMDQVREVALGAYAHQDVPFEKVVEELRPRRDMSRSPLFQVKLVLQNIPTNGALNLPGLVLREVESDVVMARFDLTMFLTETDDNIMVMVNYNRSLFERPSIERMVEQFETILKAIVEDPERRIGQTSLIGEAQRHQILAEWNNTYVEYAPFKPMAQLFEERAEVCPDAIALAYEGQQISYLELNERANSVGNYLRVVGVGPEVVVGLCLTRRPELLIALLGVLKAGGAYLPLNPNYPVDRLAFMLDDSRAVAVLTHAEARDRLPALWLQVISLDQDWQEIERAGRQQPVAEAGEENAAYIIYTSGSTGRPKGVVVTHRGLSNYLRWASEAYEVSAGGACPVHSPVGFDLTVTSLLTPLSCGGRVELLREGHDVETLRLLTSGSEQYALIKATPSHLPLLEELAGERVVGEMSRWLVLGGEALRYEDLASWREAGGVRIVNEYGPTETVVGCCVYEVCEDSAQSGGMPIGRPIANSLMYVLGEWQEEAPIGATGEIYIGGSGVARGYQGEAEKSAERFVPNPYSGARGDRMYRTGDLGRWRGDGKLEYVGRRDHQVKVRGYRIELGEVETALREVSGVREAVVLAREDEGGAKRLVAYVVGEVEAEEVGRCLRSRLPEYMAPSVYVWMEEMPLTANGKVDRERLPAPGEVKGERRRARVERGRGEIEEIMRGIWEEVLRVEEVGDEENFFELGGHSLLATQVVSRVREVFGAEVGLRSVFESPTVVGMVKELERALRGEDEETGPPPLRRVGRDGETPLSFAQQRLWFLDQLEPGSSLYNIPTAVRMHGELNVEALERSLTEVVRRHETLRTVFKNAEGKPIQVIRPAAETPIEIEDLSLLAEEIREEEGRARAREEAQRGFKLDEGPLVRMRLLKMRENDHIALLTMHHIISDGWSLELFVGELVSLYAAYINGEGSPLRELEAQYADFAVWQREWLQGETLEKQLVYWRGRLGKDLTAIQMPVDRARPLSQSHRGAREKIKVEEEVSRKIYKISREQNATLFMVLLAAWQAMLWKYSGQEDVVVGMPIANRGRREIEEIIGLFVNTLVIRTNLGGDPSFEELIRRVKEICLGAYAHQDVPFEKMVEELEPERDLGRNPLFQVMFAVQNRPPADLQMPGLSLSEIEAESAIAKFDLSLTITEQGSGLSGVLEYSTDLFDQPTIERMARHLVALLEKIIDNSRERLSGISMLTEAERLQIAEWSQGERKHLIEQVCIHELIERQAAARPDSVSVVSEESHLTYEELNERSNQFAHYLLKLGVRPEARVGVMLERSPEMVITLLGVLKAGAAYVPLDPAYPTNRLHYVIDDSQAEHVVTQCSLVGLLPEQGAKVVRIDAELEIWNESRANPEVAMSLENLAYLIYTSGSTGKPKGVAIMYLSATTFLHWALETFSADQLACVAAGTSVCFDLSIFELFAPLSCGGTVVLLENTLDLANCSHAEQVTLLNTVPSVINEMLLAGITPTSVKTVNLAGEPLSKEVVERLYAETGVEVVFNLYGPTEDTTYSTYARVSRNSNADPSIGRPIADTQVYLMSPLLDPAPCGVPGEIYLGGAGLARGYLNRPALTADRFIPHPSSDQPGARLYRTGDLARYSVDGEIEFIGRVDHQVKIRGYRVELGEIETALAERPGAQEGIVLAREDLNGAKRLVAFITNKPGHAVSGVELRLFLKQRLPDYLIPSKFVVLERLPLTPNGKIDRGALAALENHEPQLGEEFVAPQDGIEQLLAQIWEGLLEVRNIGARANFFELGGHSLLATQVASRIREAFGVEIPLRSIFEHPTVEDLAKAIRNRLRGAQWLAESPITRVSRDSGLPLSFAQQRLWFLDQLEPGSAFYNCPMGVRLEGDLDIGALERTLSEVVRRHESLRTRFTTVEGEAAQVIDGAWEVRLVPIELSGLEESEREAEVRRFAAEQAQSAFDLTTGPLLRAKLLRLGEQEHVALLTTHHIVSDGWSLGVLVKEVAALYEAFTKGELSPLPDLGVQYADYAVWQREWLKGETLDAQLSYWKRKLGGDLPLLELPTDRPRPAVQSYRGARQSMAISEELTRRLKALGQKEGCTLFMTLLAAFQSLLCRHCGQEDIIIGAPIAGRTRREIEPLIGFFANMLALRTDLSGDPSFRELLRRVREVTLEAYAHQDMPFEKLVEELQPERDLSRSPLFQAVLALQNAPPTSLQMPGLKLSAVGGESVTAKFDLMLTMIESGEGMVGALEYNTDLFDAGTMRGFLSRFQILLEGIAAQPETSLHNLPLLTAAERQQLLVEWNETWADYDREATIGELFERQAVRTPDKVALVYEGQQITYRELNERANQLAHYLRGLGVEPETLVGIWMERSLEMVVGLLGILKAGGAYMPMDPAYPSARLAYMLADARVTTLLTQANLKDGLSGYGAQVFCLDADWPTVDRQPVTNPVINTRPSNLAYCLYTSGSTGQPKGVTLQHSNAVGFLEWVKRTFNREHTARVLFSTSICFDLSVFELFSPLVTGGSVSLVRDALALSESPTAPPPTLINTVPSAAQALLDAQAFPTTVRTINLAGEPLHRALVERLHATLPQARVYNLYGPTEYTTYSTYSEVGVDADSRITIGRPVSNTRIYILNGGLEPAPVGAPGEVYITGAGLARGYLNRPDLTAEKFIPDPFSAEAGARLYRTGDLARYLLGGEIEYLGRIDHQVKIRGYRIELGEVEAAIALHDAVRDAVVIARDEHGDKRLVAYLVFRNESESSVSELREILGKILPAYLLPSSFVVLPSLPLLPNGKVDRQALPAPSQSDIEPDSIYVAPRSQVEEALALTFGEVLGIERVGIYDNFFDLGGHSLLVTKVISRLNVAFQVELPISALFNTPTVAGLADAVVLSQVNQSEDEDLSRILTDLDELSEDEIQSALDDYLRGE